MKASELLRGVLSDFALGVLDQLNIVRDPALTGSRAELRRLLEERGWPAYESALAFEEVVGGIILMEEAPLGTFAAIERRRRHPVSRDDELLHYEDRTLLPITGGLITDFWIDETGVIYRGYWGDVGGDPDGEDYVEPTYESFKIMIERFALQREPWWPKSLFDYRKRYSIVVRDTVVGAAIADVLHVALWPWASDRFASVWRGDAVLVMETNLAQGAAARTQVWTETLDDLVEVWKVAFSRAPDSWIDWHGPSPEPPRSGETPVLRFSFRTRGTQQREVMVYGVPGEYRVAGW